MRGLTIIVAAALAGAGAAAPAAAAEAPPAQAQGGGRAPAGLVREAEAFMAAYARDLGRGDRAAVAERYDRRGAWRVGNGEKVFQSWDSIRDFYAGSHWSPPATFAWRNLSYEPLGRDAVVVVGLFDWGVGGGKPPVTVSYTGLLVRRDGALKIRLEDESAAPAAR